MTAWSFPAGMPRITCADTRPWWPGEGFFRGRQTGGRHLPCRLDAGIGGHHPRTTVTSYFSIKDDLVNAGGNWVDEEVVVDGCTWSPAVHQMICRRLCGPLSVCLAN
jgi:hypothetical protein